jgi:hypothetical protein
LAVPKAIAGISPATPYTTDLSTWTGGWKAPQALYDQGTFLNSEDYWSDTISPQSASTWQSGGATGKGVLVVDLQTARTINRFSVFQTFSDGKTTHIRVYQHSSTSATVPAYNDAGWVAVMPETSVTAGLNDTANQRIASPTKIAVTSFTSRYLKIEVRNDRSLGNPTYIELKGIKAFGPAAGTTTGTTTTTSTTTTIQPSNYALSTAVAGSGKGNVTGSTPSGSYAPNTAITLRATADAGSTFTGWSPAPCASSFYMPASALTCTATFTLASTGATTGTTGTTTTAVNYLRGGPSPSSPVAIPQAIVSISPATPYTTNLSTWTGGWNAPQALYDQGTFLNSEDYWSDTISPQSASTWQSGGATGKGVLVVDMQTARTISRFSVFQTFSDGKTTQIRVYQHSSTSATVPAYNDAGWVAVMPETSVTAGLNDTANQRIANPTKIAVTSFTSRYLKIEVRNDGSLGNTTYIELKGIKAFGP